MRKFRHLILVVVLATVMPLSSARRQASHEKTQTSGQSVLPDRGLVERGTYKNPSIGLEFIPAENLRLQEPEMKGKPGTVPLLITVQALSDRGFVSSLFSVRELTVFYAEALASYPEEQRNSGRYLQKVIRANEAQGFQHVDGEMVSYLSGISFLRADFVQKEVHETVLVATHNAYAFVFIFAGADLDSTNKLIASTKIKFTS